MSATATNGAPTMKPKTYTGRRRPAPIKPPGWLALLGSLLVLAGVLTFGGPASIILSLTGAALCLAFLVLNVRHAAWVVTTGADQELNR